MDQIVRRVVKLGGSLLNSPRLEELWRNWLARQTPAQNLLLVGGGGLVDVVAELQRSHVRLSDNAAHWLAVRAMQLNAELIAGLLPEAEYLSDLATIDGRPRSEGTLIVDPWTFMKADAAGPDPLPESWDVTSDSISAKIARIADAEELVLLKSSLPSDTGGDASYVDRAFERQSRGLPVVRFVNLRDDRFPEVRRQ